MIEKIEKYDGPARVATDYDLPDLTANGWRIVALIQEQTTMTLSDEEPNPKASNPDHYGSDKIHVMRQHPTTQTRFLLVQSKDRAIADATKSADEAREKMLAAQAEATQAEAQRREVQAQLVDAQSEQENLRATIQDLRKLHQGAESRTRKMEQDVAKLRTHFGEKAMQEALDGTT